MLRRALKLATASVMIGWLSLAGATLQVIPQTPSAQVKPAAARGEADATERASDKQGTRPTEKAGERRGDKPAKSGAPASRPCEDDLMRQSLEGVPSSPSSCR